MVTKRAINIALQVVLIFCSDFILSLSAFLPWKICPADISRLTVHMQEDKGLTQEI